MPEDVAPEEIVDLLGLEPLPEEGGLYRRTYADEFSSLIYFLLVGADFSALHVLTAAEVYHWYAGAPLELLLLRPDGSTSQVPLGPDLRAGQRPQVVVPAGVWQGSSSTGAWTLAGATMAPPFTWDGFRLGDRGDLTRRYPAAAARIAALTR